MNPYDARAVQAVWQRVQAGRTPPEPGRLDLAALQAQAWWTAGACRRLAARLDAGARQRLLRLARDAEDRGRQLRAIGYVQRAQQSAPCPPPPDCGSPARLLRRLYEQEREEAAQFALLARLQPEHSGCYTALAQAAERHTGELLGVLARVLGPTSCGPAGCGR